MFVQFTSNKFVLSIYRMCVLPVLCKRVLICVNNLHQLMAKKATGLKSDSQPAASRNFNPGICSDSD